MFHLFFSSKVLIFEFYTQVEDTNIQLNLDKLPSILQPSRYSRDNFKQNVNFCLEKYCICTNITNF